jgi:large subunit ribosomal protein L31
MNKEIHPELKETTVNCACGAEYKTKSTRENISVEVCSSCHPFYTGKQRQAARGGRIERFNKKYGLTEE